MEIFCGHEDELSIWLRNALEMRGSSSTDGCGDGTVVGGMDSSSSTSGSSLQLKSAKKIKKAEPLLPQIETEKVGVETSRKGLLSFLARCLSALVNNPTPYTDRVMESLIQKPMEDGEEDEEESMDTSTVDADNPAKQGEKFA